MGRVRMFDFILFVIFDNNCAADLQNTQQQFATDLAITSHSHHGSADACQWKTTQMQQSSEDRGLMRTIHTTQATINHRLQCKCKHNN